MLWKAFQSSCDRYNAVLIHIKAKERNGHLSKLFFAQMYKQSVEPQQILLLASAITCLTAFLHWFLAYCLHANSLNMGFFSDIIMRFDKKWLGGVPCQVHEELKLSQLP